MNSPLAVWSVRSVEHTQYGIQRYSHLASTDKSVFSKENRYMSLEVDVSLCSLAARSHLHTKWCVVMSCITSVMPKQD